MPVCIVIFQNIYVSIVEITSNPTTSFTTVNLTALQVNGIFVSNLTSY